MKKVVHKFNGQNWDAQFVRPCDLTDYKKRDKDGDPERREGDCTMPMDPAHRLSRKERVIRIDKTLSSDELLNVALHEAMHATFPFLNEEWVDAPITDIAAFLVKLGFRKGRDAS